MKTSKKSFEFKVEKLVSFPSIDENLLTIKKNMMMGMTGSFIAVSLLTLLGWLLSLPLIVAYGIVLLSLTSVALIVFPKLRKHVDRLFFIIQFIIIWATFYFMLRLGGLLNSAGLLFTGISIMFMSINFQNTRLTIVLFVAYMASLIATAALQPYLTPAPEMTPWKNLLFFTINCSWQAGFTLMLILNNIRQKKVLAESRLVETVRLKELDEVKSRFFTNITHEFRTPLTVILGMSDLIKKDPAKWAEEGSAKIKQSSNNLLHLVNQMLDLSKIEAGAMQLHLFRQDIIKQLRYLVESLNSLAVQRNVNLEIHSTTDEFLMDFDSEKLMQIATNLLSNALKFTQPGGTVVMEIPDPQQDFFRFSVIDNGPGIMPEDLPKVFDRFFTVKNNDIAHQGSTGIGLTLTKELVKLMGGHITLSSEPGKGATFTVELPVTHLASLRDIEVAFIPEAYYPKSVPPGRQPNEHHDNKLNALEKPLLLIVEDSPDLVQYLSAILDPFYDIQVAVNGHEGLLKAREVIPDMILSDVMMPLMDGITMLSTLKNDERTSHIPVVMLTAKADIASKLEGLERGADDYLAKPFHEGELKTRLKNLIDLRNDLRRRYATPGLLPATSDKSVQIEDAFMRKVQAVMDANLDNDEFGIHEVCIEIGMSRAQLYRKFKSLTDKTVNEYLLNYRLFKAHNLLLTSNLNVSQVAYDTGFKNLSHFNRCFKEVYGVTPGSLLK